MFTLCYEFETIQKVKKNGYVFQYVQNRKLTNICHSHDFYEIIYMIDGSCQQHVNSEKISMVKGDILILRPYESHVFLRQTENVKIACLSVKKDEFERVLPLYNPELENEILSNPRIILFRSDRTCSVLNNFHLSYDENDCMLLLCSVINMYLHPSKTKEAVPSSLLHAISEMKKEENLRRGIPAFMEFTNYSQSHLSRLMKKHFNMNIHDYVLHLRLERAYNDIIFTNENLKDISESVGYESFSHFTKIFKRKYNITPAALRKTHGLWTT